MAFAKAGTTGSYGASLIDLAPSGPSRSVVLANNTSVGGTSAQVDVIAAQIVQPGLLRPTRPTSQLLVQRGSSTASARTCLRSALHASGLITLFGIGRLRRSSSRCSIRWSAVSRGHSSLHADHTERGVPSQCPLASNGANAPAPPNQTNKLLPGSECQRPTETGDAACSMPPLRGSAVATPRSRRAAFRYAGYHRAGRAMQVAS